MLVTHSHSDHFYVKDLGMRHGAYAHDMRAEKLQVFCNEGTANIIRQIDGLEYYTIVLNELKPFDTVSMREYKVTALPARHFKGDNALFYIIKGEKTLLYAHDTGYFFEEVFDYIEKNGFVFDLISLDCTNVDILITDEGSHMGIENIERVVRRLESMGAVTEKTQKIINHFSHNANPIHHKLQERVTDLGYKVSYDGLSVDI